MASSEQPARHDGLLRRALVAVDQLIPDAGLLDDETLRQRRLFVVSTFLVVVFAFVFGFDSARVAGDVFDISPLVLFSGAGLGLLNVFVGQRRWPARTGFGLVVLFFLTLLVLAVTSTSGMWDASLWWQVLTPLLAAFLVTARFAAFMSGLIIVEIVALYLKQPEPVIGADGPHLLMLSSTSVVFTVTVLAWAYELARKEANERVEVALREVQKANAQLAEVADELSAARDGAEHDSQRKGEFLERMRETAREQDGAIEETSAAMAEMTATFRTVAESVRTLAHAAAESGSAARQINSENESASHQLEEMVSSVEQAAVSLEEMSFSVKEVAANIARLSAISEQTSAAMNQMETSLGHVEENARSTERLATLVKADAEKGTEAVGHTRDGIQDILAISRMAGETIRGLGERIKAIDQILDVINEVAAQTQLLSLNAAIIASQAGERGRGFAVVAGEIKKLAERTSRSTKDIAAVIGGVQEESRRAVGAIADGESAVLVGLERSRDAERALLQIVSSAEETNEMVSSIVSSTGQQAMAVREVAAAMEQVAFTASSVAAATGEQARGSEMLLEATQRLQRLAHEVAQAGREQREGGRSVEAAVEQVRRMVQQLHRVQSDQARGGEQIQKALFDIGRSQALQLEAIESLDPERLRRG